MRLFVHRLSVVAFAATTISTVHASSLTIYKASTPHPLADHQVMSPIATSLLKMSQMPAEEMSSVTGVVATLGETLAKSALAATGDGTVTIGGELKLWHSVNVNIAAVDSSEMATPNPFLDYRFNVTFTSPTGKILVVPGYFNTNGAGGDAGNVWTAHLNPNEKGTWTYLVSFRSGSNVAVDLTATPGSLVSPFNGKTGTLVIGDSDKTGNDFRASDKGMLVNRGHHYLTYGSNGKPFVWAGAGIPENILGYRGFTNTTIGTGHNFNVHLGDWQTGDPNWTNGGDTNAGKKLIGAINYMANQGSNSMYLMSQTIGGDGKDCFPHPTSDTAKDRYDLLKLQQWDIALTHAQKKGIFLLWHFAEVESANVGYYGGTYTGGSLTTLRKLSIRMLNARFGHYNGLQWNLCEENKWVTAEVTAQLNYMKAIDPYDHPTTFQLGGAGLAYTEYTPHLGFERLDSTCFQGGSSRGSMFNTIGQWRTASANAGKPVTCAWDEPQKIENNNDVNVGYPFGRRDKMWPCLMGGGDGFAWYVQKSGGGHGFDQTIEDFTIMKDAFNWSRNVRDFLTPLPLTAMAPSMSVVTSTTGEDYTLFQAGLTYAIYNDRAGKDMTLNLNGVSGTFNVRWYNPRTGGALQTGSVASITGGGNRALGNAPSDTGNDWAVLVTKQGGTPTNVLPTANAGANKSVSDSDGNGSQAVALSGSGSSDSDGTISSYVWTEGATQIATGVNPTVTLAVGSHTIMLTVTDNDGASSSDTVVVTVTAASGSQPFTITLMNADNEQVISAFNPIANNATIALSSLVTANLNIRANVSGVGSAKFVWTGAEAGNKTESTAPYAMKGDTGGNYKAWIPTLGTYTLTITTYSGSGATGSVVQTATYTFTVTDPAPAALGTGG